MMIMIGILAIAVLACLYAVGIYNALVGLRNEVKNAWAQIDVQLKRRYDLIPNLIETAKGYMNHERETFEKITQARSQAMAAGSVADKSKAENVLGDAVSKFLAVAENYPDLKANQNFLALQEELSSTENKIAFSRQNYNDQVLFYNNKIQMFPSSILADAYHFQTEVFFQVDDKNERQAPKVSFK